MEYELFIAYAKETIEFWKYYAKESKHDGYTKKDIMVWLKGGNEDCE